MLVLNSFGRPVPLQHFVFPMGADGLYLVVDEKGNFREENFQRAIGSLQTAVDDMSSNKKVKKVTSKGQSSDLGKIIRLAGQSYCFVDI